MVKLYNNETGEFIGDITEEELKFLVDELEEEGPEDQDYAITRLTLGLFVEDGVDPDLMTKLKNAMGDKEEIEIRWERS